MVWSADPFQPSARVQLEMVVGLSKLDDLDAPSVGFKPLHTEPTCSLTCAPGVGDHGDVPARSLAPLRPPDPAVFAGGAGGEAGTDGGTPFWIRSVKGAVRSIGSGADILRLAPEVAVYTHWMRAARAVRRKALGCDRDACTNSSQVRLCQPRASGLRRT